MKALTVRSASSFKIIKRLIIIKLCNQNLSHVIPCVYIQCLSAPSLYISGGKQFVEWNKSSRITNFFLSSYFKLLLVYQDQVVRLFKCLSVLLLSKQPLFIVLSTVFISIESLRVLKKRNYSKAQSTFIAMLLVKSWLLNGVRLNIRLFSLHIYWKSKVYQASFARHF